MKIYVYTPNIIEKQEQKDIQVNLFNNLKQFYDKPEVEVIYKKNVTKCTVYVMGSPKYSGHDIEIKKIIIRCLQAKFGNSFVSEIDIKLNYSAFDPKFKPISDSILYPTQQQSISQNESSSTKTTKSSASDEFNYEKLSFNYTAEIPRYSFDQVILPQSTRNQIEEAIGIIEVEDKVFNQWGLRAIVPVATSALSFYGPPGTGKTMAAEAIAQKMGKKLLSATYADIESKYHGEGPKMVKAIFKAAERENAVLFLDESDSLLSKRLTNVSDGSSQAINSMRSQLLISLESFKGIVIFATNLVVNYDKAFLSRLINIEFKLPDKAIREQIWIKHLKADGLRIPLCNDLNISELADKFEFSGREIKNSVKNACVAVALKKREIVTQSDLISACETTKSESEKAIFAKDHTNSKDATLSPKQNETIKAMLQEKLNSDACTQNEKSELTSTN